MKWSFFRTSITALLIVSNFSAFSKAIENQLSEPPIYSPGNWFISLGSGIQFPNWHSPLSINNDTVVPTAYEEDVYSTKNRSKAILALSAGKRWQRDNFWLPSYSFGVFWQYFFRTNLGNTLRQNSNPQVTHYKYDWDLTSSVLLATAKMNLFRYINLSPYINGGIGSSFNRTSSYSETGAYPSSLRVNPGFGNFSTSEFAYNLGAGIDLIVTPRFIISLGYNYQNLGQVSSGPGKETWSNQSLNPGSYNSNELLLSLTYLFGT